MVAVFGMKNTYDSFEHRPAAEGFAHIKSFVLVGRRVNPDLQWPVQQASSYDEWGKVLLCFPDSVTDVEAHRGRGFDRFR